MFLPSIHYMATTVCGRVKMQPGLVPPTVFFIPLGSPPGFYRGTLFLIYNGKTMFEIFTTTRRGKSFNKTWAKTMVEVALTMRIKWVCRNAERQSQNV